MKRFSLFACLLLALAGCPTTNSEGDQTVNGDSVSTDDAATPGSDVTNPSDTGAEPDVVCVPQCTEGVCGGDGCGGDCPGCGDLPAPYGTACTISGTPDPPTAMKTVEAFPKLAFTRPVYATSAPDGTDRIFVVEKRGVIKMFGNDPNTEANDVGLFLDIQGQVDASNDEGGLLGLAFHPDFVNNRYFFVNYTGKINNQLTTIVSRFTVGGDGMGDPSTELILLTVAQPFGNHNGGGIEFGPDGYLYTGLGDGGSGGDPYKHGQNTQTLLGAMLRIDVDTSTDGKPYGIPADNPFVGGNDGKHEIWAWGLRNPWRFSFDRLTGQLWAADVGQELYEEVVIVEGGKNYGWNIMEGNACYSPKNGCDKEGLELPVAEYDHSVGKSITGGYVYRGTQFPALTGAYLYADYVSGVIFAARFEEDEGATVTQLVKSNHNISSFGEDQAGELLLVDFPFFQPTAGKILRLAPADGAPPTGNFPLRLSDTGCFKNLTALEPVQGVIPYSVNSSLWHDGARSERHFVLPQDAKFEARDTGAWTLPDGGKLIKTFVMDTSDGGEIKLETRFLLREGDQYRYYTYRWNAAQTDADLLSGDAEWTVDVDGEPFTWHFPSRSQCATCHNPAAGHVL
ncbi:MAG: glucose/arabinose dehydrogenase, partial [Myxococcota bacterium]